MGKWSFMFFRRDRLKFILILVFLLSITLRVFKLAEFPTFISDEASIGYNAWSILKTGKDEWGKSFPLYFKAFGEYKLPVYIYLSCPFLAIFGLNEAAVRFPSAIAGSLIPVILFFLVKTLFAEDKNSWLIGLLAAFLLAINPWHVQISRMAIEANLALFITLLGIYFLLVGEKRKKFLYLSFLFFGLTFFIYNANRVFLPLFLGILAIFSPPERKLFQKNRLAVIIFLFSFFLVILTGFRGTKERIIKVGIFSDQGIIARIIEKRLTCEKRLPPLICRGVYNRVVFYPLVFSQNYLSHFNPQFFFQGAGLAQYGVPKIGVIYAIELPFLLTGFLYLLKKKKSKAILLSWILTAPVANSITGLAHPVRSLLLLPILPILISLGIYYWFNELKSLRNEFLTVLFLIYFISLAFFLSNYWLKYPYQTGSIWQSGYKPLFRFLKDDEQNYQVIWVSKFYGEPHIFYLFNNRIDPAVYQSEKEVTRYVREDGWINVDRIGKYTFFEEAKSVKLGPEKEIAVFAPSQIVSEENDEKVYYQNGSPAFIIKTSSVKSLLEEKKCPCSGGQVTK